MTVTVPASRLSYDVKDFITFLELKNQTSPEMVANLIKVKCEILTEQFIVEWGRNQERK